MKFTTTHITSFGGKSQQTKREKELCAMKRKYSGKVLYDWRHNNMLYDFNAESQRQTHIVEFKFDSLLHESQNVSTFSNSKSKRR
jgi:hypothetical protein